MKTIDEVIKTLELCINDDNPCSKCPYTEYDKNGEWACSMCGNFGEDALYYLKEYRNNYNNIININKDYFYLKKEMEEWYNKVFKPLSWDELKNYATILYANGFIEEAEYDDIINKINEKK